MTHAPKPGSRQKSRKSKVDSGVGGSLLDRSKISLRLALAPSTAQTGSSVTPSAPPVPRGAAGYRDPPCSPSGGAPGGGNRLRVSAGCTRRAWTRDSRRVGRALRAGTGSPGSTGAPRIRCVTRLVVPVPRDPHPDLVGVGGAVGRDACRRVCAVGGPWRGVVVDAGLCVKVFASGFTRVDSVCTYGCSCAVSFLCGGRRQWVLRWRVSLRP